MGEINVFVLKPYVTQFYFRKCSFENLESKIYTELDSRKDGKPEYKLGIFCNS